MLSVALVLLAAAVQAGTEAPEAAAAPGPAAIETLLNTTAAQVSAQLAPQGRGYSYYTYGTDELLYAVGDLDGDGRAEIAARAVYFLGVGSYDLVDVFADRGSGYQHVDRLNLYHLGLEDEVEALSVSGGLLHIATVGRDRGRLVRRCRTLRWPQARRVGEAPATERAPSAGRSGRSPPPAR